MAGRTEAPALDGQTALGCAGQGGRGSRGGGRNLHRRQPGERFFSGAGRPPGAWNSTVRSGALLTADGRPLGRTYAYGGSPSWVFMDVTASGLSGIYTCELHLADGATVTAGVVVVYHGTGDWAHTVKVQAGQIRGATLVASTGVTVATATFS